MRALVTCCTALTGCLLKSYESQKIQSSQRFIYHGSGRRNDRAPTVLAGSWRYSQNISKLESVPEVVQCRPLLVEREGCVGDGTSLSWKPCRLVDPSRLEGTSFLTPEDDRRHQQFAATLEGLARQNVELQTELAQSRQQAAIELAALRQEVRGCSTAWDADDGSRCGHAFAGEAKRLLRGAGRVARLEHSVQGCTLAQRYHVCRS